MSLEKHVNKSGFPLQIGLAYQITSTEKQHEWRVLYQEHSWKNEFGEGFIDIVLEHRRRNWLINIECKRVLDTSWIFLVLTGPKAMDSHCKLWISYSPAQKPKWFDWLDMPIHPETYQSNFCVVQGQDRKSRPMLERTAANVVSSTEALANEELNALSPYYSRLRMYLNVIVTTANLKVHIVDPSSVDLVYGKLKDGQFEDVSFLRFRKQLSYHSISDKTDSRKDEIRSLVSRKENTVFIVQAHEFLRFLDELKMPDPGYVDQYLQNL